MKLIKLASILPTSEANGPGSHFTFWVQGCTLKCPGCFNPHTHDLKEGYFRTVSSLVREIATYWNEGTIRGVTLTGGEPLQQMEAILHLLTEIKKIGNVGTILLTGYTSKELKAMPDFDKLIRATDVFITGRYLTRLNLQEEIRGSSNKELLFYSSFYTSDEFSDIPPIEIITQSDGSLVITGIQPELLNEIFRQD